MKKFSKLIVCLLLCVLTIGVVGCKPKDNKFHPTTEATVVGNGGMVVKKGEYVYFANGFQKVSELTDEQRGSSFIKGGLYVAKLDEEGKFVRDDDGLMVDDYIRTVSDKLAGFDATDLYIFGEYLYFVSPSMENESGKIGKTEWAKDRAVFYRVKLSNFDDVQEIYTANVKHENLSYQYYFENNKPYLLVYEKGEDLNGKSKTDMLYRIDVQAKRKKDKVKEVASGVKSIVFGYNSEDNAVDRIYFVENKDSKYNLVRYNVASNERLSTEENTNEVEAKFVSNKYVFVTKKSGDSTYLYRAEIGGAFTKMFNTDSSTVGSLYLLPEGETVLSVRGNKFQFFRNGDSLVGLQTITDTEAESEKEVTTINVIGFANGSIVYYDNNNCLKTVSYSNFLTDGTVKINTLGTIEFNADYLDLDGGNLYYCTGDNAGYLYRINVTNNHGEEGEMVGVYTEADKPAKDDEE